MHREKEKSRERRRKREGKVYGSEECEGERMELRGKKRLGNRYDCREGKRGKRKREREREGSWIGGGGVEGNDGGKGRLY